MRCFSPHDVSDILRETQKRTGKSDGQIVRETGVNKGTWRNIKRGRCATAAYIFLEFYHRYAEMRDVVDEYLDLKSIKQQQTKVHSPHVSPSVASTQGSPIRL
jgi:hypothetical protein